MGLATILAVLPVAAEIVVANGLDRVARPPTWSSTPLLTVGAAAAIILVAACSTARPSREWRVRPSTTVVAAIVAASAAWGVAPHLIASGYQDVPWAIFLTAVYAGVLAHSLSFHATGEGAERLASSAWVAFTAVIAAASSALFWLLARALWEGQRPVAAPAAVEIVAVVLIANGILVWLVGVAVARTRHAPTLSTYPSAQGLSNDLLGYAGFGLLFGAVTTLLASHFRFLPRNDETALLIVLSLILVTQAVRFIRLLHRSVSNYLEAQEHYLRAGEHGRRMHDHFRRSRRHFVGLQVLAVAVGVAVLARVLASAV